MTQSGAFRAIVLLSILLDAILSFYSHLPLIVSEHLLWLSSESVGDPRLATALSGNHMGALLPPHPMFDAAFHYGSLSLSLLACIGLLWFKNWARHLFLALAILGVASFAAYGLAVSTPFEMTLGRLIGLLDGAVLALAYLSPLRDRFISRPSDAN